MKVTWGGYNRSVMEKRGFIVKKLLEKLSLRSCAGAIAESIVLMGLMSCILLYRKKCEEEIRTLSGMGVIALVLFGVSYRYLRGRMSVRDTGYMGRLLTVAGAGVLSLLVVLLEVALVCLIA